MFFFFLGPGVNKAVLLQLQQAKAKASQELETRTNTRQVYDNLSYEDNEIKLDPDSEKAVTDASGPSTIKEKVERIDRF